MHVSMPRTMSATPERSSPRHRPHHRPPLALRVVAALLGIGVLMFNAALMLSDRAPSALKRVFGDWVRRLSERIDAGDRISSVASDPRLPESDAIVHIAVWALAIGLVGVALWTWAGLVIGGVVVWAGSIAVELAQGRLSDTRQVEMSDVIANSLGVAVGVVAVASCYVAWSALARLFGGGRYEYG